MLAILEQRARELAALRARRAAELRRARTALVDVLASRVTLPEPSSPQPEHGRVCTGFHGCPQCSAIQRWRDGYVLELEALTGGGAALRRLLRW